MSLNLDYPKITVVTPNYNGAEYLEDTIQSVLSQNYPNLEYIIVDGGSDDGSLDLIKKYEKHLAWWVSEPDRGMYNAILKGFGRSSGEIMSWLNSDDMYHRKSLFIVADIFNSFRQVNWLVGATTLYDESGRTVFTAPGRAFSKFDFYNHDFKWIQQESVFWRRDLWEKAGASLNPALKYACDFDLWIRFFSFDKLYLTKALIGGFRLRSENQISLDHLDDYLSEVETVLSSLTLNKKEERILADYNKLIRFEQCLKKLKLFGTNRLSNKYRKTFFDLPGSIDFDRHEMRFIVT